MEYDYEKELLFHKTPFGFRLKIYDILLLFFVGMVFSCCLMVSLVRHWFREKPPDDLAIPVKPLQEIPHFKTSLYQIRQEGLEKKNKKKAYQKYAASNQGTEKPNEKIFECVTCGFKVQKTSFM